MAEQNVRSMTVVKSTSHYTIVPTTVRTIVSTKTSLRSGEIRTSNSFGITGTLAQSRQSRCPSLLATFRPSGRASRFDLQKPVFYDRYRRVRGG